MVTVATTNFCLAQNGAVPMKAYQQFTLGLVVAVLVALLLKPVSLLISGQIPQGAAWGGIALCFVVFVPMLLLLGIKQEIKPVSLGLGIVLTLLGVSWTWTHLPEPQPSTATIESMSYTPYSDEPSVSIIRTSTQ